MTNVSSSVLPIDSEAGEIGQVASSSTFATPLVNNINHLLGYHMGGLIHFQNSEHAWDGTGRFYTYLPLNCEYLCAFFYINVSLNGYVDFTAGSGTTVRVDTPESGPYTCVFPFGASDTGFQEVTYETKSAYQGIQSISIFQLRRDSLSGTDYFIPVTDTTYPVAHFGTGGAIAYTDTDHGVVGLAGAIKDAKDYTLKHAVTWCLPGSSVSSNATSWTNIFSGNAFHHKSPQWKANDTEQPYYVVIYSKFDGDSGAGESYEWRAVTGSGFTASSGTLTNTSYEWNADPFYIDCTADDYINIDIRNVNVKNNPTTYIQAVSIVGYY